MKGGVTCKIYTEKVLALIQLIKLEWNERPKIKGIKTINADKITIGFE